jgi:hypothetical protein
MGSEQRTPMLGVDIDNLFVSNFNAGTEKDRIKFKLADVRNYKIDEKNKAEILR